MRHVSKQGFELVPKVVVFLVRNLERATSFKIAHTLS